ncbi:lantibiotic dehydratase [Nonomuraea sp. NPDC049607]|uniref:lantibiotic dehydratase n=1 Tax=Nonomuraea sp. NPDC049607 TaxID=3154732 RepID=UPI0034206745
MPCSPRCHRSTRQPRSCTATGIRSIRSATARHLAAAIPGVILHAASTASRRTPFEGAGVHAADLDPAICVNAIGTQHGRSWRLFPRFGMAHAVLPTVEPGAELAQSSFHPCRVPADLLTRAPQALPRLVRVGEFRPLGKGVLFPGDLAVGFRDGRLYLTEAGPEAVELSHLSRLLRRRGNASRMAHPNSRPMAPTSHRFLGWCTGAGPSCRTGRPASSPTPGPSWRTRPCSATSAHQPAFTEPYVRALDSLHRCGARATVAQRAAEL